MAKQTTIVINEGLSERQRTTRSGVKSRFTLEVQAEPIVHNLSHEALGAEVAVAIRDAIAAQIRSIAENVLPSTLLMRKYAKHAFERSSRWAVKRYAGGRTGATPPGDTAQLFNDSGRLANGLSIRQNTAEDAFTINSPKNRLDPSTFRGQNQFVAMTDRLRRLVPALGNPQSLWQVPNVRLALGKSVGDVLVRKLDKSFSDASKLRAEIARQGFEAFAKILEILRAAGGE